LKICANSINLPILPIVLYILAKFGEGQTKTDRNPCINYGLCALTEDAGHENAEHAISCHTKGFNTKCVTVAVKIFMSLAKYYYNTTYLCSLKAQIHVNRINISHRYKITPNLECGPMPNVMAALPNIGGALCSTPQSVAARPLLEHRAVTLPRRETR